MKHHNIKCIPPYFKEVEAGIKTFEVRLNDRDYEIGDTVTIQEYFPDNKYYTGKEVQAVITYVLKEYDKIQKGYVVFAFKRPHELKQHKAKICNECGGTGQVFSGKCIICQGKGITN